MRLDFEHALLEASAVQTQSAGRIVTKKELEQRDLLNDRWLCCSQRTTCWFPSSLFDSSGVVSLLDFKRLVFLSKPFGLAVTVYFHFPARSRRLGQAALSWYCSKHPWLVNRVSSRIAMAAIDAQVPCSATRASGNDKPTTTTATTRTITNKLTD